MDGADFFSRGGAGQGQKSAGPLNSTLGKFGNYSRGVVFSGGCKPLLSFWPWLSYCFIMAFLKWKNSRVSPLFCPVVLTIFAGQSR